MRPAYPTPSGRSDTAGLHRAHRSLRRLALSILLGLPLPALSADPLRICLNWAPGADHAPLYHARAEGWFAAEDLAVELRPGGGSADALAKLATGECEAALADFGAVSAARAKGQAPLAVFAVFADSPLAFYAVAPVSLESLADVAGKRVGADPKELARRLWLRLAERHGIDPAGPTWVDMPNNAKTHALREGAADLVANTFYHHHAEFVAAFGDRLRVLWWRDLGVNPLGNVIAVDETLVRDDPRRIERFVHALQRSHAACVRRPDPCLTALVEANPHLDREVESAKWRAAAPLMAPTRRSGQPIGGFGLPPPAPPEASTERFLAPDHTVP